MATQAAEQRLQFKGVQKLNECGCNQDCAQPAQMSRAQFRADLADLMPRPVQEGRAQHQEQNAPECDGRRTNQRPGLAQMPLHTGESTRFRTAAIATGSEG